MSRAEQVTRVARVGGEFRLTAALRAIGLPRATWYRHQRRRAYADKYGHLREALEQIARTHPEYGYRRVAVELQRTWGQPVNAKVVRRLHRLWDLPVLRTARRPRPSGIQRVITTAGPLANLVDRTSVIPVLAVTYTDFSQLVLAGGRRIAYLIVLGRPCEQGGAGLGGRRPEDDCGGPAGVAPRAAVPASASGVGDGDDRASRSGSRVSLLPVDVHAAGRARTGLLLAPGSA